jgi:hypothetical protein
MILLHFLRSLGDGRNPKRCFSELPSKQLPSLTTLTGIRKLHTVFSLGAIGWTVWLHPSFIRRMLMQYVVSTDYLAVAEFLLGNCSREKLAADVSTVSP